MTPVRQHKPGEIAAFIDRYAPAVARQFRVARATLRKIFPRGYELVYGNYNALGCGFSATTRSSGIVVSVVAYPKWVTLFFFEGRRLSDPEGLLQGSGVRIRSLRLQPFELLESRAVKALLAQALDAHAADFQAAPRLSTIIKSVASRRRSRRCELVGNADLKRKVDADAASIRDSFPKGVSRPALRALHAAGYRNLRQLAKATEQQIADLHGMGPKAMHLLRAGLKANRLRFKE